MPKLFFLQNKKKVYVVLKKQVLLFNLLQYGKSFPKCAKKQL